MSAMFASFLVLGALLLSACSGSAPPPVANADTTGTTCADGEIDDGGTCVPEACGTGTWGDSLSQGLVCAKVLVAASGDQVPQPVDGGGGRGARRAGRGEGQVGALRAPVFGDCDGLYALPEGAVETELDLFETLGVVPDLDLLAGKGGD
jgi:hypothetical protein